MHIIGTKNTHDIIDNFATDEENKSVFFSFSKLGKWVVLHKHTVEDFGNR